MTTNVLQLVGWIGNALGCLFTMYWMKRLKLNFTALTIYLEELMPFQHFFMGLTIAGIIRNGPISALMGGVYGYSMRHQSTMKKMPSWYKVARSVRLRSRNLPKNR